MSNVRVLLPTGFGINCEAETSEAFQRAGAKVEALHLNDLLDQPAKLARTKILAFAGGFSFGDHLGAGRALANRVGTRMASDLHRFVDDGGFVIGICNGFQTMVRLGLLPGGKAEAQTVTLAANQHGAFYDGWVTLRVNRDSPCLFTRGIEEIDLPVRHGEGRLLAEDHTLADIEAKQLVPLRYVDPVTKQTATQFPSNPNGSALGAAGLCDPSGRIFGLMPHPEAFLYPENHPQWRRRPRAQEGGGLQLFRNAVEAAC